MHTSYNKGESNQWVAGNSPYSMGYFKRKELPTHFDVADGWTIADMYQESILAATDPNRIIWMSGTVNNPGTPSNPDGSGGMVSLRWQRSVCRKIQQRQRGALLRRFSLMNS